MIYRNSSQTSGLCQNIKAHHLQVSQMRKNLTKGAFTANENEDESKIFL